MGNGICTFPVNEDERNIRKSEFRGLEDDASGYRHQICLQSWRDICQNASKKDGIIQSGAKTLTVYFFENLRSTDSDHRIYDMFQPRPNSRNTSSNAILFRIITYLLTIGDETMATKQAIRSLGRTHARIGISRKEILVFNTSFLKALQLFSSVVDNRHVLTAWSSLLEFVMEQMTFDTIIFRNHCTPSTKGDEMWEPTEVSAPRKALLDNKNISASEFAREMIDVGETIRDINSGK